jgi:hypothetical protein
MKSVLIDPAPDPTGAADEDVSPAPKPNAEPRLSQGERWPLETARTACQNPDIMGLLLPGMFCPNIARRVQNTS